MNNTKMTCGKLSAVKSHQVFSTQQCATTGGTCVRLLITSISCSVTTCTTSLRRCSSPSGHCTKRVAGPAGAIPVLKIASYLPQDSANKRNPSRPAADAAVLNAVVYM